MLKQLPRAIAIAAAIALAPAAGAQTGSAMVGTAPGAAVAAQTIKITATITAIDKSTRDVTLKGPEGNLVTVTAGPEVKNFDKLKVGDKVDLQYLEALTLELKKGGGMIVGRTEQAGAASAKPGEKPAAGAGRQVTIVADVVALDPAKQIVTLKGPQRTVDLRIPDPEQFKRIAKGDQVEAKYTQAVALTVEAAK
jgi:Cu/Ag efflux protein CusF